MTIEPGSPNSELRDAEIDAFFESLFGDSFPELNDLAERRQLIAVAGRVPHAQKLGIFNAAPPADLQSRVLNAVRGEAAGSQAQRATSTATLPSATGDSTINATNDATNNATNNATRLETAGNPFVRLFKRFRVRIVVVLVALVVALTVVFSSFGSSPVVAASAVLSPNPGSVSPMASGTVEFLSPKKGGQVNKVEMTVEGLAPNTNDTEYQCWLVGTGDSPTTPNRILVGTFSTEDGAASFDWKTTGYSADFTQLDVSLEKKDGNPTYGGVTVLSTIKYTGKRTG